MNIRVVVWNENVHEQSSAVVRDVYPNGIHGAIAESLNSAGDVSAGTATLQESEHGLSDARLADTDVLLWWGHAAHGEVADEIVDRVQRRVWEGMGLIVLHSGHFSKVFRRLMGTPCSLTWREAGEKERVWAINPTHPIAAGLDAGRFELVQSEMYGEPFAIPEPLETVFVSWYSGGEVFRSGCTWQRGAGRIFYFGPGHETYPIYHDAVVQRVLLNAVRWAHNGARWHGIDDAPNRPTAEALEPIEQKGPRLHEDGEAGLR